MPQMQRLWGRRSDRLGQNRNRESHARARVGRSARARHGRDRRAERVAARTRNAGAQQGFAPSRRILHDDLLGLVETTRQLLLEWAGIIRPRLALDQVQAHWLCAQTQNPAPG
jgi:hypothetical protein